MIAALTRRPLRLAFALLAACAALALLALAAMRLDWDSLRIEMERSHRLAYAAMGAPLPGTPDLDALDSRLAAHGVAAGAPVFIRIFKLEFELELWMKRGDRFHLFATYPICRWSGALGPKLREGDWQAPEGFYTVDAKALNPHSRWHRAFNLGFPNDLDQAHGRTGSYLMVHGGCSSIGCYAMTDPVIDEVWRLVTAALNRGQRRFHVHIFPFRMTEENLAHRSHGPWAGFWRDLKPGYDLFEGTWLLPRISICQGRYAVSAGSADTTDSAAIDRACPKATGE
jgi:murein L,D-transpeptidase YafK